MSCSRAAQGREPGLPSVHHCRQATALGHSLATLSEAPSLGPPPRAPTRALPSCLRPLRPHPGSARRQQGPKECGSRGLRSLPWRSWGREGEGLFPAVSVL